MANDAKASDLNNKAEKLLHSNPDSALILLDSALKFNSEDYVIYFNIGHVYIGKEEYPNAIDIYKRMLLRKPDFPQAITFLGMLYEKTGQSQFARINYKKAISIYDKRLINQDSILNEDKVNRIFTLFLLDSASAKPQLEHLLSENPQSELLKMLNKSSKAQIINGFFSN